MPNSFYTPTQVSAEFLRLLEQELVLGNAVGTDLSSDFQMVGNTIKVRRQMQYLGQDNNLDLSSYAEDIVEGFVNVSMNQTWSNKVQIGALDRSLSFDRWSDMVLKPMARRAAEKIENNLAGLYTKFYHFDGTPGTTPSTFLALANAGAYMTDVGMPVSGRVGFHAPVVGAALANSVATSNVQGRNGSALDKASIGMFANFDNYITPYSPTHTVGGLGGTPLVNGANQGVTHAAVAAAGGWQQTLITDGWTAAAANRLKAGDVFTIAGVFSVHPGTKASTARLQTFTVLADAASDGSGNATLTISPPMITSGAFQTVTAAPADNAAITVKTGSASTGYRQSLLLDPAAIVLVSRPLDVPDGKGVSTSTKQGNKVTISVTEYTAGDTLAHNMRFDMLWGSDVIDPRRGLRLTA